MSRRILLIDDDRLPTVYYSYALKQRGFEVSHCEDADMARQAWRETNPSLIILDIMMPPGKQVRASETKEGLLSGLLLYRWLRSDLPKTPVIILTHLLSAKEAFAKESFAPTESVCILQKSRVPPLDLATIATRMIGESG